jgi:hypothetical protein
MKANILDKRLTNLESVYTSKQDIDWQRRLERYRRYFEGLPDLEPQTEEELARLERYKRYFDEIEAGVAAPRCEQ